MQTVRVLKKTNHLLKSVQAQSRQIITNIYASGQSPDEQLQFTKDQWQIPNQKITIIQQPQIKIYQPLKNLRPLFQHLSKDLSVQICPFIIANKTKMVIIYKQTNIIIKNSKLQKNQLKYWFSHIYFFRFRNKLIEKLIQGSDTLKQTINFLQEKEYLPVIIAGSKKQSGFVRQIRITKDKRRKKGEQMEKQPFCVANYHNGAQQLFTFNEIISFIQQPFNLTQVSYFKILPKLLQDSASFQTQYSKKNLPSEQNTSLERLRQKLLNQKRSNNTKKSIEQQYLHKDKSPQFYSNLKMLEIVALLQTQKGIIVKELRLEWIVDVDNNVILSNVLIYRFSTVQLTENAEGLATLYQKYWLKSEPQAKKKSVDFVVKKNRSQQKYKSNKKLPLLNWKKSTKIRSNSHGHSSSSPLTNNNHSCVLPYNASRMVPF